MYHLFSVVLSLTVPAESCGEKYIGMNRVCAHDRVLVPPVVVVEASPGSLKLQATIIVHSRIVDCVIRTYLELVERRHPVGQDGPDLLMKEFLVYDEVVDVRLLLHGRGGAAAQEVAAVALSTHVSAAGVDQHGRVEAGAVGALHAVDIPEIKDIQSRDVG